EKKWQHYWAENDIYKTENTSDKPKFYALDMFPYPSGAGLHVGHPLGYIASDIVSRYKRLKGFNVLHPMGFDSFGLPAEQYAIQTGQHPAITTEQNIKRYKEQLKNIGFSFDWDREVQTHQPDYYRWTQWIFMQLFNSWYNNDTDKAEHIDTLIARFEQSGNAEVHAVCDEETPQFSAEQWNSWNEEEQLKIILHYRLTFPSEAVVNWCPALGTVLANDEIKDGVSERGGHPLERKKMKQWMMRITAYADRLLKNLEYLDWSEPMKDMQTNWIGKSYGCELQFDLSPLNSPSPEERGPGGEGFYKTANADKWKVLKEYARENRKNPTPQEDALWQELRNKKTGFKIRRQHPIGDFITDFACLSKQLVIEIDGGIHQNQQEYDQARTEYLNEFGFKVIRFANEEVDSNIDEVVDKITKELLNTPSPEEREPGGEAKTLTAFTTRPDTIYGVTFMVMAPEHDWIGELTTSDQKAEVEAYVEAAKNRSERERQTDVKSVSGVFTGSYAINPFNNEPIPIWVADYVLAGYGTGVVMAVPSSDDRDYRFAKHFDLPVTLVIEGSEKLDNPTELKHGVMFNSGILDGLKSDEAIQKAIAYGEENGFGNSKVNFRIRDAVFSRQRYWGEPVPAYFKGDIPYLVDEKDLPIELPPVDKYKPTETGEPPLGRAKEWTYKGYPLELTTMPGWAASSWYFLRYMDANNEAAFADKSITDYWGQVDLYLGGTEHATGHLLYSRFWNMFLYDRGLIDHEEPFKKLINQGMIQGISSFVYRIIFKGSDKVMPEVFLSKGIVDRIKKSNLTRAEQEIIEKILKKELNSFNEKHATSWSVENVMEQKIAAMHVDISLVKNDILDVDTFKSWRPELKDAIVIPEADKSYICGSEVEKMSKRYYNVVNPDDIVVHYGADTLRLYEMFLGPLEQFKPWNTNGIDGVFKFLRKLWNLFHKDDGGFYVSNTEPTKEELKILHRTIKKAQEDIERYSFNTSVSEFMICVNDLTALKCNKGAILEPLVVILSPYAPHIAEELWHKLGHVTSITRTEFPSYNEAYLVEDEHEYPVSVNGKMRAKLKFPLDMPKEDIEKKVLADEVIQKWLDGKAPKKVIVVPKKIVNVVV
ncbi:MAG: leucine--tRNA ligase, partial [Fulvivirga sp.]